MDIEAMAAAIEGWARSQPLVRKAYLFGSRVKGSYRSDSDLDVAVELITLPGEDSPDMTWQDKAALLRTSIAGIVPVPIDLDWYGGPVETPCLHAALQSGCLVVYDEASSVLPVAHKT